jgi:hypothetical protein
MSTVTRYIGICPVCEGEYRLHRQRMVHHGYKRPGHGSIQGDCPGVGYPPYELSTEGTEVYLIGIVDQLDKANYWLQRLQSGDVQELNRQVNKYSRYEAPQFEKLTPADGWKFKDELQQRIKEAERRVDGLTREQNRCRSLIQNWRERPLRTLEEVVEVEATAKRERSAVRDAQRAERQAKRDATRAKADAREQRYQDFLARYRAEFQDLARDPARNKTLALATWKRMFRDSKKSASSSQRFLNQFVEELRADGALVDLGLAQVKGDYLHYADDLGWVRP